MSSPVRLNTTIAACLFALTCLLPPSSRASSHFLNDSRFQETHSESREFIPGGMLHVNLRVGDLHIRRGDSTKIRLTYTIKSRRESYLKDAQVDFDIHGRDATLEFHAPSGANTEFDVDLEVPAYTNLDLNQKVGDIRVEDVTGDKNIDLGVGDIRVRGGDGGYQLIRGSTGIGDLHSDGYGSPSGWLGKSLRYRGDGKYELRARVGVGDLWIEN